MDNREDRSQPDIGNKEDGDKTLPPIAGAENASTTYDVSNEAEKALQQYISTREDKDDKKVIAGEEVTVRVEVKDAETPIILVINRDIVIGRRDPTTNITPELDLTPYGGYQMGISRKHALLGLTEKRLTITDSGSRNGTYLNGYRLKESQPVRLHDGDEVRLGKIIFKLFIQSR